LIAAVFGSSPVVCLHSTYLNMTLRGLAATANGINMQNNIEMKSSVVDPRPHEPINLNSILPELTRKPQRSGFTREEMRRIVAEQID
jgi:hypothetical protein